MSLQDDIGFDFKPDLPIAISCISNRYLLFDVKIATYLRRQHNICGLTIGTLPLAPSQNLFLGMPLEIMPEEAQLLVERGIAFIVDDARAHEQAMAGPTDPERRARYLDQLKRQTKQVEDARTRDKEDAKKRALEKKAMNKKSSARMTPPEQARSNHSDLLDFNDQNNIQDEYQEVGRSNTDAAGETLPAQTTSQPLSLSNTCHATPATSQLLLPPPTTSSSQYTLKDLPSSYPLYRHLHDKGFFLTPGLRFGCQYTVYPGDPLRFHSHFLAVGYKWDEETDLVDLVGGGRLGTGVKKGFLMGGQAPDGGVRTFSLEWAAM